MKITPDVGKKPLLEAIWKTRKVDKVHWIPITETRRQMLEKNLGRVVSESEMVSIVDALFAGLLKLKR